MDPITQLPPTLQPVPYPALAPHLIPDDIWHPSIERVPEHLAMYLEHPKINTEVHYVEVCLVLRSSYDTTKQLHWCLLFTNWHYNGIPVDEDLQALIQQPNHAWLLDPCSGFNRNKEEFLHFLNSDELAERRLNLLSVAMLHCSKLPQTRTFDNVLPFITKTPKKELLCCSVTGLCPDESHLVDSTRRWALAMLQAIPCFGFDPAHGGLWEHTARAIIVVAQEMHMVAQRELQLVARGQLIFTAERALVQRKA